MIPQTRIALLGYGYLGKWHAQKLSSNSNIEFVAIVEPNVSMHQEIKTTYPKVKVVTDIMEVLSAIDAALVVTPTSLHEKHVSMLLEHNKHVFCEKPLAHNYHAANELYKMSKLKNKLITQVGHSERCHKIFQDKKQDLMHLVQEDGFCLFERYGAFKGRATDVSCVEDIMVHDLDLMMYVFNPQLVSCSAIGIKSKTTNWDTVQATFQTKNQTYNFFVSRDAGEERRQMSCFSSKGSVVINFMNNKLTTTENGLETSEYEKRDHLTYEQNAFITAIKNNSAPMVSFHDGRVACYLVEVVLQALKTQQPQVISLPLLINS